MSTNKTETTPQTEELAAPKHAALHHVSIASKVRDRWDAALESRYQRRFAAHETRVANMEKRRSLDAALGEAKAEFEVQESKVREQHLAEDARLDEAQTAQLLKADKEIRAAQEALAAAEQAARDAATKVAEATNAQAKLENDYVNAGIMRVQRRHQEHEARAKAQQAKLRQITRGEADLSK